MRAMICDWARAVAAWLMALAVSTSSEAVTASRWLRVMTRKATARKVMTESMSRVITKAIAEECLI